MSIKALILLASLAGSTAPATVAAEGAATAPAMAHAALRLGDGTEVGTVTLTQGRDGVLLQVEAHGLTPGWHGIHLHKIGQCTGAAFTNAGGHVHDGPETAVHGLLNPAGNDDGDLPNLWVGADGTARAQFYATRVDLGAAAGRAALMDADGSALVIHAAADDHSSQPIGGAGARVACGVILG